MKLVGKENSNGKERIIMVIRILLEENKINGNVNKIMITMIIGAADEQIHM